MIYTCIVGPFGIRYFRENGTLVFEESEEYIMQPINKVRGYRSMLGMTQDEFANAVGINPRTYFNRESGVSAFTVDELKNIKQFLADKGVNVSLEDLA